MSKNLDSYELLYRALIAFGPTIGIAQPQISPIPSSASIGVAIRTIRDSLLAGNALRDITAVVCDEQVTGFRISTTEQGPQAKRVLDVTVHVDIKRNGIVAATDGKLVAQGIIAIVSNQALEEFQKRQEEAKAKAAEKEKEKAAPPAAEAPSPDGAGEPPADDKVTEFPGATPTA